MHSFIHLGYLDIDIAQGEVDVKRACKLQPAFQFQARGFRFGGVLGQGEEAVVDQFVALHRQVPVADVEQGGVQPQATAPGAFCAEFKRVGKGGVEGDKRGRAGEGTGRVAAGLVTARVAEIGVEVFGNAVRQRCIAAEFIPVVPALRRRRKIMQGCQGVFFIMGVTGAQAQDPAFAEIDIGVGETGPAAGLLLQVEPPVKIAGRNHFRAPVRQPAGAEHKRAVVVPVFVKGVETGYPVAPTGAAAQLYLYRCLISLAAFGKLDQGRPDLLIIQPPLVPHIAIAEDRPEIQPVRNVPVGGQRDPQGPVFRSGQIVVYGKGIIRVRRLILGAESEAVGNIENFDCMRRHPLVRTGKISRCQETQRT